MSETRRASAAHAWYSVAADPPPLAVAVRVRWDGRELVAARVADPRDGRRGRVAWAAVGGDGARTLLPRLDRTPDDPRHPHAGWHIYGAAGPDLWRPQMPERWALPLPAPAHVDTPIVAPQPWSATLRFTAVDDAEAADLAREMEADRADARSGPGRHGPGEAPEPPQWWLDPHAITYSKPGAVTPREAEGRLMRALNAERWVVVERPADRTFAAALANAARTPMASASEIAAADPPPLMIEPTGRDRDDMLTALAWLQALVSGKTFFVRVLDWRGSLVRRRRATVEHPGEWVIRRRALIPPQSWREIGRATGRSHEAARDLYASALAEVTRAANGEATAGGLRAAAELAALRIRNRQAREG